MENKIETIRRACIAANPSILDLVFGCKVKRALSEGGGFECSVIGLDGNTALVSYAPYQENYEGRHYDKIEHLEIIGRPIRLADVLLAIKSPFYINAYGQMESMGKDNGGISWDLKHDDLNLQTQKTINFLYDLLSTHSQGE